MTEVDYQKLYDDYAKNFVKGTHTLRDRIGIYAPTAISLIP